MTIARYVLDTNIITAILKKEPTVAGHVGEALSAIVVTDNEKHLAALGVTVENWRR